MHNKQLKTEIEALINASQYGQAAETVAKELGIKLISKGSEYKQHFANDKACRHVFKMRLSRGKKSYTFDFGQSIVKGGEEPNLYDVLACLQKYDVGTFENFCSDFGYNVYSRSAKKTYKAVLKGFEAMERLFTNEELKLLSEIN